MMKRILISAAAAALVVAGAIAAAKHADLAGAWYPSSPGELRARINEYLRDASVENIGGDIIGVIAPHAGIRYSGPVAGYAFKALAQDPPGTVIVVGFTHRKYFADTVSVFTDDEFVTPLGGAKVNMDITGKLMAYSANIKSVPEAFSSENSIELEIPFIQVALEGSRVVLVALTDQNLRTCRLLADALYYVLRDEKDFAILASTDMCHQLPYEVANKLDAETVRRIEAFDPVAFYKASAEQRPHEHMCGMGAVYSVMDASKRLGADRVKVLKYANSGDTSGMKDRVVGYMSAVFIKADNKKEEEQGMFTRAQKQELLNIARSTISHYLETGKRLEVKVDDPLLEKDMGAFVTLHRDGQLRGCIGHMVAAEPLYLTVRDMAIASATNDWRFTPVKREELDEIDIEISVLTPMEKIDDYNRIEMGKHGVMVKMGPRSGVYLPQVADETGWDRDRFMNSLCTSKAGIPEDSWKTGKADIYVFTAEVFGEKDLK